VQHLALFTYQDLLTNKQFAPSLLSPGGVYTPLDTSWLTEFIAVGDAGVHGAGSCGGSGVGRVGSCLDEAAKVGRQGVANLLGEVSGGLADELFLEVGRSCEVEAVLVGASSDRGGRARPAASSPRILSSPYQ
jgi:hypothetical protein